MNFRWPFAAFGVALASCSADKMQQPAVAGVGEVSSSEVVTARILHATHSAIRRLDDRIATASEPVRSELTQRRAVFEESERFLLTFPESAQLRFAATGSVAPNSMSYDEDMLYPIDRDPNFTYSKVYLTSNRVTVATRAKMSIFAPFYPTLSHSTMGIFQSAGGNIISRLWVGGPGTRTLSYEKSESDFFPSLSCASGGTARIDTQHQYTGSLVLGGVPIFDGSDNVNTSDTDGCDPYPEAGISVQSPIVIFQQVTATSSGCNPYWARWTSSNSAVAVVDYFMGIVTGVGNGHATITVSCEFQKRSPSSQEITVNFNEECTPAELRSQPSTGLPSSLAYVTNASSPLGGANDVDCTPPGGGGPPPPSGGAAPPGCHWYRDYLVAGGVWYWTSGWYQECDGGAMLRAETVAGPETSSPRDGALRLTIVGTGPLANGEKTFLMQGTPSNRRIIVAIDTTKATVADLAQAVSAAELWSPGFAEVSDDSTYGAVVGPIAQSETRAFSTDSRAASVLRSVLRAPAGRRNRIGTGRLLDLDVEWGGGLDKWKRSVAAPRGR